MYGDVRQRGMAERTNRNPNDAYHWRARNWRTRVIKNGGAPPSQQTMRAVSNFTGYMERKGLDSLMGSVAIFAPDNLTACMTPLYSGSNQLDPFDNTNFVAADLTHDGLKGDGSTKELDTGFVPSKTLNSGSGGITCYIGGNPANENAGMGSIETGTTADFNLNADWSTNLAYAEIYTSTNRATGSITNWIGLVSANVISTTSNTLYKANSSTPFAAFGTKNVVTGVPPSQSCWIYSFHRVPAGNKASRRYSFAAFHFGLTEAQSSLFYDGIRRLRMELGGGY